MLMKIFKHPATKFTFKCIDFVMLAGATYLSIHLLAFGIAQLLA
tara:strand:+ start:36893 stop:37024 length:132 start_codon:yes stop_codon:yes gene_type:complete